MWKLQKCLETIIKGYDKPESSLVSTMILKAQSKYTTIKSIRVK